jgi:hypothetical protein
MQKHSGHYRKQTRFLLPYRNYGLKVKWDKTVQFIQQTFIEPLLGTDGDHILITVPFRT